VRAIPFYYPPAVVVEVGKLPIISSIDFIDTTRSIRAPHCVSLSYNAVYASSI
jgi:hypothetical protein